MLSKDHFEEISKSIIEYGRPLEKSLFEKYFYDGSEQEIISVLNDKNFKKG